MTTPETSAKPCPQCGKPVVTEFRPFCSARCKKVDLGKWFNESYVIPGDENVPANDENDD